MGAGVECGGVKEGGHGVGAGGGSKWRLRRGTVGWGGGAGAVGGGPRAMWRCGGRLREGMHRLVRNLGPRLGMRGGVPL